MIGLEEGKNSGLKWISIKDKSLILLILQSYADPDKKKILDMAEQPKIIIDIIDSCKLPQTSSYRKINMLIRNGLLIPDGRVPMRYGKKVTKYVTLFKNIEIKIINNDIQIRAKIGSNGKNAVLRMMRENVIKSKKFMSNLSYELPQPMTYDKKSNGDSLVPYLLRTRLVKV